MKTGSRGSLFAAAMQNKHLAPHLSKTQEALMDFQEQQQGLPFYSPGKPRWQNLFNPNGGVGGFQAKEQKHRLIFTSSQQSLGTKKDTAPLSREKTNKQKGRHSRLPNQPPIMFHHHASCETYFQPCGRIPPGCTKEGFKCPLAAAAGRIYNSSCRNDPGPGQL